MTPLSETSRPAPPAGAPASPEVWTCPFCSLLCDDLSLRAGDDGAWTPVGTDCPRLAKSIAWFKPTDRDCTPSIDGKPASLQDAIDAASRLLHASRRPLFGGMATDVAGTRALYALASGCGAIIDHLHGDATTQSTLAMQDRGSFFTTMSEIRTRADLIVCIGGQPSDHYPRFFERTGLGTEKQPPDAPATRGVVFLGTPADPALKATAQLTIDTILPDGDLYDTAAILSALCAGRPGSALRDHASVADALLPLVERLKAARYAVLVWETGALPGAYSALLVEAFQRIVKSLNSTTRAASFALGGSDGATTVNYTLTWLSGFPLRTRIGGRSTARTDAHVANPLDYDPHRYGTARLLQENQIDALLWVSSYGPQPLPAALPGDVPAVVLCHPAMADAARNRPGPTVVIPVATPGIDSASHLFRVDSSVVVPLTRVRDAGHPTVADVAARCSLAFSQLAQADADVAGDSQ